MITRRQLLQSAACAAAGATQAAPQAASDYSVEIGPYSFEASPRRFIRTVAYNSQVPGPLLRFQVGRPVTIAVTNRTKTPEVVHWHGLFLPSEVDGAMEEGTPAIAAGASARYTFTPRPEGFRWYHTHTFAGRDFSKGQYTGQHGFLWVEPRDNPGRYDAEFFLGLHDWRGQLMAADDGSMNPFYDVSTINGRVLGFAEPLRVKEGQRVLLHFLNSSATDIHWLALAGHQFEVVALDGNPVPKPEQVGMLRLSPAERISAVVTMNNPGVWVLGEVRKHIKSAGMGMVVEYADRGGAPVWEEPEALVWDYLRFGGTDSAKEAGAPGDRGATEIPLVFKAKFAGHGAMDHWTINGKSFPHTDCINLKQGERYRLLLKNESTDDHPVHLHRNTFELRKVKDKQSRGILKDTVLVDANTQTEVEFTANDPGATLFHCHQQDHMDTGFMMLFRYV